MINTSHTLVGKRDIRERDSEHRKLVVSELYAQDCTSLEAADEIVGRDASN